MFDTLPGQIGAAVSFLVVSFALLKGGEAERFGAGAYALGWLASLAVQGDGQLYSVQWAMLVIDFAVLTAFIAIAWRSRQGWPIWAAAFQGLSVLSHIMAILDVRPAISAYYTVINLAGYGVLISLAVGVFWAWQERRAAGLE